MKQTIKSIYFKGIAIFFAVFFQIQSFAQDAVKVEVNEEKVGNWFQQNWMWVAGGVLLLLIIIIAGSGRSKSRRTSTTVVKDDYGNTRKVTTTEVED